ncbi:UNVERIFIED_CONTAM: hypothetical protein DES50_11158 [Williamsia faeni]
MSRGAWMAVLQVSVVNWRRRYSGMDIDAAIEPTECLEQNNTVEFGLVEVELA